MTQKIVDTAVSLAQARRAAAGMSHWPGAFPPNLDAAYALQEAARVEWGQTSGGVKVGRILGEWETRFGVNRFTGPIDASAIQSWNSDAELLFPVIPGGTAVMECEIIVVLRDDTPDEGVFTPEQARNLAANLHIGIEVAGGPIADINAFGPLASIGCFGNNNGALIGPAIASWRELDLFALACTARIDGAVVGKGDTSRLPGGIWEAVAFALMQSASINQHLRKGDIICSGALTGMHPIAAGQMGEADFGQLGVLRCRAVQQVPSANITKD